MNFRRGLLRLWMGVSTPWKELFCALAIYMAMWAFWLVIAAGLHQIE